MEGEWPRLECPGSSWIISVIALRAQLFQSHTQVSPKAPITPGTLNQRQSIQHPLPRACYTCLSIRQICPQCLVLSCLSFKIKLTIWFPRRDSCPAHFHHFWRCVCGEIELSFVAQKWIVLRVIEETFQHLFLLQLRKKQISADDPYPSTLGFPGGFSSKESTCRRHGFDPWSRMIPWRRKWQPTSAFLPGKSHGQKSQAGYSPWGCKKSDTTKQLNNNNNPSTLCISLGNFFSMTLKSLWWHLNSHHIWIVPWTRASQF